MNAYAQRVLEKLRQKIDLQKRLAARRGDAALFVKHAVFAEGGKNILDGHLGAAPHVPSVGIVTIPTAKRAAL